MNLSKFKSNFIGSNLPLEVLFMLLASEKLKDGFPIFEKLIENEQITV